MHPDLAEAWPPDRPVIVEETSERQLRRLPEELAKIGEKWWLINTSVAAVRSKSRAPWPWSALAEAAIRIAQEESARRPGRVAAPLVLPPVE